MLRMLFNIFHWQRQRSMSILHLYVAVSVSGARFNAMSMLNLSLLRQWQWMLWLVYFLWLEGWKERRCLLHSGVCRSHM